MHVENRGTLEKTSLDSNGLLDIISESYSFKGVVMEHVQECKNQRIRPDYQKTSLS